MLLRSVIAIIKVMGLFQAESNAQWRFNPLQRTNRYLGLWAGSGYHFQNPAPNVGCYNPYSNHNSGLVTRGYIPQDSNMYFNAQPRIGQPTTVLNTVQQPFPPEPIGGSYESFEDDTDVREPEERFDVEEKDGFDLDEENELLDLNKEPVEKETWEAYEKEKAKLSNSDFELPQDALEFGDFTEKP